MNTNYFLPKWYLKQMAVKINKRFKIVIVLLAIANITASCIFMFNKNKLESLIKMGDKIKYSIDSQKSENIRTNNDSVNTYFDFFKNFNKYGEIKNVSINSNNVDLEFSGENDKFLDFVKSVERSGKFIMKDMSNYNSVTDSSKRSWKITFEHI